MTFEKPTLPELINRGIADIEFHTGKPASTRGDIYYPIAMMHAGACYGMHGYLDSIRDQMFDDSADDEHLLLRAAEVGIYQIAATRAQGTASIMGNNDAVIAENTLYTYAGRHWRVTEDVTIVAGEAILSLRAVTPGSAGNLPADTTISIMATIAGVDTNATIINMAGGADVEPVSRVRARLRERRKNPPMGGNANDYKEWAKAAHVDVTRAWAYNNENGIGTIVVRFVTDNLLSPIPSPAHNTAVFEYIDKVRPSGMAGFDVGIITAKPLNITFISLSPNNASVRAAVEAELDDMIRRDAIPGGVILLSHIREAISIANGENDYAINITGNITSNPKELIMLGVITWPS